MGEPVQKGLLPALDPKSGQTVQLPAEELFAKFDAGDLRLLPGQTYPLARADGTVWDVPAEKVNDAINDGHVFATEDAIRAAEARTAGAQLQTVAEGVVNRVAFGGGDALLVGMGADPKDIAARAKENKKSRLVGEVIGGVAGAAGLGAIAPGALGAAAAETLLGDAATSTLGHVATGALGASVEGGAHGIGDAVSEAALGQTDLTAESLFAHGGAGFALGGAIGGVLGVPLSRLHLADKEALARGAVGEVPEGGAVKWFEGVHDAYKNGPAVREAEAAAREAQEAHDALLASHKAEAGAMAKEHGKWARPAAAWQRVEAAEQNLQQLKDRLGAAPSAQAREELVQAQRNLEALRQEHASARAGQGADQAREVAGQAVDPHAETMLDGGPAVSPRAAAEAELGGAQDALRDVRGRNVGANAEMGLKHAEEAAFAPGTREVVSSDVLDPRVAEVPLSVAQRLEKARARVGQAEEALKAQESVVSAQKGVKGAKAAEKAASQEAADALKGLRMDHKVANAELRIAQLDAQAEASAGVRAAKGGIEEARAAGKKLADEQAVARAELRKLHAQEAEFQKGKVASNKEEAAGLKSRHADEAAASQAALDDVHGKFKALGASPKYDPNSPLGWAARIAGYKVAGPLGGAIAESAVRASPGQLAAIARVNRYVQESVGRAMGRFVKGTARTAEAYNLPRVLAPLTLAIHNATTPEEKSKAIADRMDELAAFGSPEQVSERAVAGTTHLEDAAPDTTQAVRTKAVQLAEYVRERAPVPLAIRNPMKPAPSYDLISARDADRFAQVDAAVQDPMGVLERLADGEMPAPEALGAVRDNYPQIWSQAQAAFQHHLAEHPEEVSWSTTVRAGIAFGLATAPALEPLHLQVQQAAAKTPPAQPKPGRSRGGRQGGSGGTNPAHQDPLAKQQAM